jgi:hypothetical protein
MGFQYDGNVERGIAQERDADTLRDATADASYRSGEGGGGIKAY